jgi:hypothetical protein
MARQARSQLVASKLGAAFGDEGFGQVFLEHVVVPPWDRVDSSFAAAHERLMARA